MTTRESADTDLQYALLCRPGWLCRDTNDYEGVGRHRFAICTAVSAWLVLQGYK